MRGAPTDLERLWNEHEAAPFPPECADAEFEGTLLVMLDADIAGHVSVFLHGDLDRRRLADLANLVGKAERAAATLRRLHDPRYWTRLAAIGRLVIEQHAS